MLLSRERLDVDGVLGSLAEAKSASLEPWVCKGIDSCKAKGGIEGKQSGHQGNHAEHVAVVVADGVRDEALETNIRARLEDEGLVLYTIW